MKLTRAYIARLSGEGYVKIDQDEIDKVIAGMQSGNPIVVRDGVINPSYIIGIMEDRNRMREWFDECRAGFGEGEAAKERGIKPMRSIFEGTNIGNALKESIARIGINGSGSPGGGSGSEVITFKKPLS